MGRLIFIVATALSVSLAIAAQARKPKEDLPQPCPIDGTLRTADPKLLERFSALAGCADELLVAPATPADFVEPDGTVIIRSGRSTRADLTDDDGYEVIYANTTKVARSSDDGEAKQSGRKQKKQGSSKAADAAKTEYYSYGSTSPSLAGTGIAIRIVPEPQPVSLAPYSAGVQTGGIDPASPLGADDQAILAMRPQSFQTRYDDMIGNIAVKHRVDPLFLHAVIYQESRYRSSAVSHAGATGLMQIMPATGRTLGVHPSHLTDPLTNVDAGARLLRKLHQKYGGNFDLILAAYNAGEGAVAKYGNRIPPYRETQEYVKLVMGRYSVLLAEQNGVAPPQ